jgi:peroxiredoxin Q/BCP
MAPYTASRSFMHHRFRAGLAATLLALVMLTGSASAQQPAPAPAPVAPEVGTLAPDFALAGATRYGLLRDSVHLSNLRGKTVVLAFFYKARTKG